MPMQSAFPTPKKTSRSERSFSSLGKTARSGERRLSVLIKVPSEKGVCVNISTGGMCLNTNLQLKTNQHVMLMFDFVNTEFVLKG